MPLSDNAVYGSGVNLGLCSPMPFEIPPSSSRSVELGEPPK